MVSSFVRLIPNGPSTRPGARDYFICILVSNPAAVDVQIWKQETHAGLGATYMYPLSSSPRPYMHPTRSL